MIGGAARLARAIDRRVPGCRLVVRAGRGPAATVVDDYRAIPAVAFNGVARVVNCVGTPVGDVATLAAVNVEVAVTAARRARDAGVRQFIQVGSLSVYGGATDIDGATPVAPVSDYGRSKANADAALAALATPEFCVTLLRVPALYGPGATGKFGQLARVMTALGRFPVFRPLARRSVLNLDNAAVAIAALLDGTASAGGVQFATDHEAFTLDALATAVTRVHGKLVRLVPLPAAAAAVARHAAPGAFASLYADSVVAPAAAMTTQLPLPVALGDGLAAMLAVGTACR